MANTLQSITFVPMTSVVQKLPSKIITSKEGHASLWQIHKELSSLKNSEIIFDCSALKMIQGNMCALFLILIEELRLRNSLTFQLKNCKPEHSDLFTRNGLFQHVHSIPNSYDFKKSTVRAQLFNSSTGGDLFGNYIKNDLFGHRGLDILPEEVKKWLELGFVEAFSNVAEHANTDLLATCGQLFPNKNQFHFTFCDMGGGFFSRIETYTTKRGNPITTIPEALDWALRGNSTREDIYATEGGTALRRLVEYCEENTNCSFSLVTDSHYWKIKKGKKECHALPFVTKGTTIHLIFN